MTKKERREKLQELLDHNPKMVEIIDGLANKDNLEIKDIVEANTQPMLEKARTDGIMIGWNSYAMSAISHIKQMKSMDEVVEYFEGENKRMREKLGLSVEIEEDSTDLSNV